MFLVIKGGRSMWNLTQTNVLAIALETGLPEKAFCRH